MPQILFRGKHYVENHHLTIPFSQLLPVAENGLSEKPSLNDNLIVHGDNLRALKALLPVYEGRVKCIYIDPPYNTGNENWQYNDAVNSPFHKEWLGHVVGIDDLERHDKWLCMMMPRLKLLREFLREDGMIFVSIDYNEVDNLRLLMDEVFGEENYRNTFVVSRVKKNIQETERIKRVNWGHNYLLFYAKSDAANIVPPRKKQAKEARWHSFDAPGIRDTMSYNLFGMTPPENRHWMYEEERAKKMIEAGQLRPHAKTGKPEYFLPASDETDLDTNWTDIQESDSTWLQNGGKNVNFVKRVLQLVKDENAIILDSFAGSGTTAQAVLEMNKEDGGNRQFILVETEDYANSLTAERVRRVIQGVPNAKNASLREGLAGTFSYFELGAAFDVDALFAENPNELPSYENLARFLFYTATGSEFDASKIQTELNYIGESADYHIFLYYQPDWDYLMNTGFTLNMLRALPLEGEKERLVYAPSGYVDDEFLHSHRVKFLRLPYDIYRYQGRRNAN